jgi:hypothetical protein
MLNIFQQFLNIKYENNASFGDVLPHIYTSSFHKYSYQALEKCTVLIRLYITPYYNLICISFRDDIENTSKTQ